jgi:RNAse (barnase) inhibitor barstar
MALFGRDECWERLDWRLLRCGPVALYFRQEVLAEDVAWLQEHQYGVYSFDCATWQSEADFHTDVSRTLSFPDYYGRNLAALNDCLSDLDVPDTGGTALQFQRFDAFSAKLPQFAWHLLDIIARNSWDFMLFGRRLLALVQSDDPLLSFDRVGARPVSWNPKEWSDRNRGL